MIDNRVAVVSNYATEALQKTLDVYAKNDYKLVNAILAENKYNIDVMYLFFTKESAVAERSDKE